MENLIDALICTSTCAAIIGAGIAKLVAHYEKTLKVLNKTVESLTAEIENSKQAKEQVETELKKTKQAKEQVEAELEKAKQEKNPLTQEAYNIAVDTWININDHLYSLGKARRQIQPVYRLLAGLQVSEEELTTALSALNNSQREEIKTIVADIRQFMDVHRPIIDRWLEQDKNEAGSFIEAVRMPQGQVFNPELDEDLLDDDIPSNALVTTVMRVGFLFPSSRTGSYRNKTKCVVER